MFDRLVVALLRSVVRRSLGPAVEFIGGALDVDWGGDDTDTQGGVGTQGGVNEPLIPAAFPQASVCDHTQTPVGTREDAGNGASRTILSWPSPSDGAA